MTSTHENGTDLLHSFAELKVWLGRNAPHLDAEEVAAGIKAQAQGGGPATHIGALSPYPVQARHHPDNGLVRDANGQGTINRYATARRCYGNPDAGRIDRMVLETRN